MIQTDAGRSLCALLVILTALPWLGGCGGDGRVAVSGTVTVDGVPLPRGTINFRPVDAGAANTSGAGVEEGCFRLPAAQGLMPGRYQVSIQAFRPSGRVTRDPDYGLVAEQMRVRFQEAGRLEAAVEQRGANEFHFAITTANPQGAGGVTSR